MSETLIFEDDIGTAYEDEPSVDPNDATVVLAEQTLTFNGTDPLIIELSSPLVVGQAYRVMWNGTAHTSTAADSEGVVFIGNAAFSGLDGASDTGEPFAIAYFDGGCMIFTLDAGDHTVAIYQEVEDVHASNDAVILSYSQNPVEYKAVPKVWLTHPDSTEEAPVLVPFTYGELLEGVEIMPDFAEGDMQISVPDGSLVKEATIIKPEDLTPENIRKGVTIGGIEGEFLGDTEEIEVELDMADGDQVILPAEEGKSFSKVTVKKPETLVPENIAKDVEIGGIVGTHEGGGGDFIDDTEEVTVELSMADGDQVIAPSEDGKVISQVTVKKPETLVPENIADGVEIGGVVGTNGAPPWSEPEWIDNTCFWDYDGTLIAHMPVGSAAALTELPTPPAHDGLTFIGWNYTLEQVNAYDYPIDVGAMYAPSDGNTHLTLVVTSARNLAVTLYFQQTVDGGVSIDWGDGTISTPSGTGAVSAVHTYAKIGTYKVVITVAEGCVMTLGQGTAATSFVGGSNSTYKKYLTELYIGNNIQLSAYSIYNNYACRILTLPNAIESIPTYCLYGVYALATIIPSSCNELQKYSVYSIGTYNEANREYVVSIPDSVSVISTYTLGGSYVARISLPRHITALPDNSLTSLYCASRIFMSDAVTSFGASCIRDCRVLPKFKVPSALVSIGDYCLYMLYNTSGIVIPAGVTSMGKSFLYQNRAVKTIRIPAAVTSIDTYFNYGGAITQYIFDGPNTGVYNNSSVMEIIYLGDKAPSSLKVPNYHCSVYVPDSLYSTFYNLASSDYKPRIRKHSEYPGTLPT